MVEHERAADVPVDDPERRLDALIDATHDQLREVVRRSTADAREELAAAAAAVAEREVEIAALQAAITAERVHLVADRDALEVRMAELLERERAVDAAAAEVADLRARATLGLASALERSARLIEEADAQAAERAIRAKVEATATLQRAVDRGREIVATAEAAAARSKAELRQLIAQIEGYIEREQLQIDLDAEPRIELVDRDLHDTDLSAMTATRFDVPAAEDEPGSASTGEGDDEVVVPGDWPAAAFAPVLVPSAVSHDGAATDGSGPEAPIDAAAEHRVTDAVRRAVRGWSAARQDVE